MSDDTIKNAPTKTPSAAAANTEAHKNTKGRANLRPPFPKGVSGNPNGRPKKHTEIKKTATAYVDAAIAVIAKAMNSTDEKVALAAAAAMLDRALGKPKQAVEVSRPKTSIEELRTDELIAALQSNADPDGVAETQARH